jgi:hypothetical protein
VDEYTMEQIGRRVVALLLEEGRDIRIVIMPGDPMAVKVSLDGMSSVYDFDVDGEEEMTLAEAIHAGLVDVS